MFYGYLDEICAYKIGEKEHIEILSFQNVVQTVNKVSDVSRS